MKIKLSHHAKRRARLYKISESTIKEILTVITNYPLKKRRK